MPNITVCIYLTDEQFLIYVKNKKFFNKELKYKLIEVLVEFEVGKYKMDNDIERSKAWITKLRKEFKDKKEDEG